MRDSVYSMGQPGLKVCAPAKAQRRKANNKFSGCSFFLCVFAPLREILINLHHTVHPVSSRPIGAVQGAVTNRFRHVS